jgi:ATP synthase F1 gamma subunit
MATRKEVTARINSVKNIRKITRAMEMVAAARLRRAEQRIDNMRPYAQAIRKLTQEVAENTENMSPATAAWQARSTPRSSARAFASSASTSARSPPKLSTAWSAAAARPR